MALELSFMTAQDLRAWTIAEFAPATSQFVLFEKIQPSPNTIELLIQQRCKILMDPTIQYLKVTCGSKKELVASAKWGLYLHPRNTQNGDEIRTASQCAPEHQHRLLLLGNRPHLELTNLNTKPEHRRKGAASILIRWGLDVADKHAAETYIEAHEGSKAIYEKFGFRTVGEFDLDLGLCGGEGIKHYFCMIRQPVKLVIQKNDADVSLHTGR